MDPELPVIGLYATSNVKITLVYPGEINRVRYDCPLAVQIGKSSWVRLLEFGTIQDAVATQVR